MNLKLKAKTMSRYSGFKCDINTNTYSKITKTIYKRNYLHMSHWLRKLLTSTLCTYLYANISLLKQKRYIHYVYYYYLDGRI